MSTPAPLKSSNRLGRDLILLVAAVAIVGVASPFLVRRQERQRKLAQCESNEQSIARACDIYSTDNQGRYPLTLKVLTPKYLPSIPTCPAASSDTYSSGYLSAWDPDAYTLYCSGHHHTHLLNNRPIVSTLRLEPDP